MSIRPSLGLDQIHAPTERGRQVHAAHEEEQVNVG